MERSLSNYVSAYYYIAKPTLPHMGLGRYLKLMPDSFRMIRGSRLNFFYDEPWVIEIIARMCAENQIKLVDRYVDRGDLIGRPYAEKIYSTYDKAVIYQAGVASKKEKGVAHHLNLVADNPPQTYIDNVSVWLSKIDLVRSVSESCEVGEMVCWVDAGIAKFRCARKNWRFWDQKLVPNKISHYGSRMQFQGRRLPLNASFLAGSGKAWQSVYSQFYGRLDECCTDGYLHDEETILSMAHLDSPELFHTVGQPYSPFLGRQRYLARRLLDR